MMSTFEDHPLAVEMKDIVVRFPGVLANDRVNFNLRQGEIHALLGENGAEVRHPVMNSTLLRLIPTRGSPASIMYQRSPVNFSCPGFR